MILTSLKLVNFGSPQPIDTKPLFFQHFHVSLPCHRKYLESKDCIQEPIFFEKPTSNRFKTQNLKRFLTTTNIRSDARPKTVPYKK